jgi:histidine phosphotransferase ChpT
MVDNEELVLAELMCARLCHDLAGTIGAVSTGAELLSDEGMGGGLAGEALALLVDSAAAAGRRLRFLRVALGSGTGSLGAAQLAGLVTDFLTAAPGSGQALTVDWRDGSDGAWPGEPAKLLLNLVLLARDCLPRGGKVVVRTREGAAALITVAAEGPQAAPGEAVAGLEAAGAAGLGPRGVIGYYAARLAARCGQRIERSTGPDRVIFTTL